MYDPANPDRMALLYSILGTLSPVGAVIGAAIAGIFLNKTSPRMC